MRDSVPDPNIDLDRIDDALVRAGELPAGGEQRLRPAVIAVLFALAVVAVVVIAGYVSASVGGEHAYNRSSRHTDERIATLESDLAERRAANQRQNVQRDQQIGELRRLVCVFADHAQPRDEQVRQVRAKYGCNGGPYPEPVTSPSPAR
jgi:hypothetical protein